MLSCCWALRTIGDPLYSPVPTASAPRVCSAWQAGDAAALHGWDRKWREGPVFGGLGTAGLEEGDIQYGAHLLRRHSLPLRSPSAGHPASPLDPGPGWRGEPGGVRLPEGEEGRGGCCFFRSGASLRAKRQQQLNTRRGEPGSLLISTPTCSAGRWLGVQAQGRGLHGGGPGAY